MRILSGTEIRTCLSMKQAIEVNKQAFRNLAQDKAKVPDRLFLDFKKEYDGVTLVKPAYIPQGGLGMKVVSVRPHNAEKGLPTVPGFVVLVDEETGQAQALMDGTYLTALRTAAGSGVATDLLARRDSKNLCVFGAGMQARAHIEAVCCVREIEEIHIVNRSTSNAEKLAEEIRKEHKNVKVYVSSASEGLKEADIICTTTNASTPLFNGSEVSKKGVHINAVGSYSKEMQELDVETIKRSKVFLDSHHAMESGDLYIPLIRDKLAEKEAIVFGDLGAALLQEKQSFRESHTDITLFKSVGIAVQDVATAYAALKAAEEKQLGSVVQL